MNKRAPWALTLYFAFFLVLLVWGRIPEEQPVCANQGLRLLSPATQQFISEYQAAPFCPSCGGKAQRAAAPAPLFLQMAGTSVDGKNGADFQALPLPRPALNETGASDARLLAALLPDQRLASLRTVVLLN
ncbi:hypothetical protein [Geoalkalibacter halelectricus]|uniref:hypothetical protein n=1 Tax=Geoalkalibacter halelectricus TaxID=2847045 RepID=UPI0026701819|nr:hypothetical protein [Geoalkalibacter halelectricus]MDO3377899.1 hypothetical protein [Geoalkalibacter halelectricus]